MMATIAVPPAEFTPYLLQQSGLRASLLKTNFGFGGDEWDDLRQEMALDCLKRLPKFDPARGNWKGFVHGVVRNRAFVLATQQTRRSDFERRMVADTGASDEEAEEFAQEAHAEDARPDLELSIDVRRALATLPEELQSLTHLVASFSLLAVRRQTGLSRLELERRIGQIRTAFAAAGLSPDEYFRNGRRR